MIKLQKEISYLKDILNLKRKGGAHDLHQQLLVLKEENSKLRDIVTKQGDTDKLREENYKMRHELMVLKNAGAIAYQNEDSLVKQKMIQTDSRSKSDYSPSLIDGKNYSKTIPDYERGDGQGQGGFFMTQSEQFMDQANSKSPLLIEKEKLAIEYKKHSPRARGLIPPATRDVMNSHNQSD